MPLLDKNTKVVVTVKDFVAIAMFIGSMLTIYFTLRADIAEAKLLPPPEITTEKFDFEVRATQENLKIIQEDIKEIKDVLHKLEERIYESK